MRINNSGERLSSCEYKLGLYTECLEVLSINLLSQNGCQTFRRAFSVSVIVDQSPGKRPTPSRQNGRRSWVNSHQMASGTKA